MQEDRPSLWLRWYGDSNSTILHCTWLVLF